ncbi:L,D-transpeptidase family protein [Biostraticola tofi]|uniref:L,D-transpeptidase YcfS n=1 Tax=Biostraticola tofi TaxID=466109 RepID=A0A4R3Z1V5_9GAMM|nr:L,D-transpeptidase family protein [Biostraticola tofi]TCV99741.1 L,D-transpeptidase YcfS [Biostraticola tofi]
MKRAYSLPALIFAFSFSAIAAGASAATYPLPPPDSRLIGENVTYTVPADNRSLEKIAAEYQIGLLGMLEANPGTDPYLPKSGSTLTIPSQMLLPDAPRKGIVVNLAELRLYYYPAGENRVIVYPIGIGQLGRNTPVMTTAISQKIPNPTWTPTANIRKRYLEEEGITLPGTVPAGPENPMGLFALRLSAGKGTYLIHGTNADFGIGMRVSSGCIRLRPTDIEDLFNRVPKGTRVQIMNDPVKTSVEPDGKRYIEVHQPLSRNDQDDPQTMALQMSAKVKKVLSQTTTDKQIAKQAMARRSGMPVLISAGIEPDKIPAVKQSLSLQNAEGNSAASAPVNAVTAQQ